MHSEPGSGGVPNHEREVINRLEQELEGGRLTRSAVLRRAAALGLSAGAIGALTDGGVAAAASRGGARARKASATKVLRVVDVGNGTSDTLNPHKQVAPIDGMRMTSLYDKLVINDSHYNPQPWLGEEFTSSKDAKTWTIRLVPNATFHDGTPVTADNIQFTVQQILDPKVASNAVDLFAFMRGAQTKILDKRTIRFILKEPYADVPAAFGDAGTNILPLNFDPTTANTAPNGSGPFKFVSFTPGQESVFVKNPNYWNPKYPLVDELHLLDIADESARINALLGGQVDVVTNVSYSQLSTVKNGGMQIFDIPSNYLLPLILAPDVAPFTFKDKRIREAFAMSIDRQQIIDVVFRGHARIGNDQPISAAYPNHPVGIPVRKRNIKGAKQLLAQAGHANGLNAVLWTGNGSPGMLDLATVVAQQVKAAGFHVKLKVWPADSFWSDVWLKKDFYTSGWTQRATPELFLGNTAYSHSKWNESHYRDPVVDKLLTKARQVTGPKQRTQLYSQALARVAASAQWIIPAYGNIEHAAVKGFKWEQLPAGTSAPYFHNASIS